MPETREIDRRFTANANPTDGEQAFFKKVRGLGFSFAMHLSTNMKQSRELSLALTKIEEAVFWANAGVAREGKSNGSPFSQAPTPPPTKEAG